MKFLVTMCGLPGSGKSAVAAFLQAHEQWLCSNKIRIISRYHYMKQRFEKYPNPKERPSQSFFEEKFLIKASNSLQHFDILIFDGTFHTRKKREAVIEFATHREEPVTPLLIYCDCRDREVLLQRLVWQVEKNKKEFYNCTPEAMLEKYRREFEPPKKSEGFQAMLRFDTSLYEALLDHCDPSLQEISDCVIQLFKTHYVPWYSGQSDKTTANFTRTKKITT